MGPTPEFLAALRRQRLARVRRMTPEQKLSAGPQLFALAIETMRTGIRLEHPEAGEEQIRAMVRPRLERLRRRDEVALDRPG